MPVEIRLDNESITTLGPEEGGVNIPNINTSITWNGDEETQGVVNVIRSDVGITKAQPINKGECWVFVINELYAQENPFSSGPVYVNHELEVERT